MAARQDLAERSAPFLPPGSHVRHAFICQTAPNFAYFLITYATGLTLPAIKYRCVTITDDRIYVLSGRKSSGGAKPTSLAGVLPRHTRLGPVSGRWARLTLLGQRHWVHQRFHAQIANADTDEGFTTPSV